MSLLKSIFYGLISGLTEFLPVSSAGHRAVFSQMFGEELRAPILDLFIHISILAALLFVFRTTIFKIRREVSGQNRRRIRSRQASRTYYDYRLVRSASIPLVIGTLLSPFTASLQYKLVPVSIFFILNGIILFVPSRMLRANKDAGIMTMLEGLLIGVAGVLSVFPGISRVGCIISMASIFGANSKDAFNWSVLISIPVLIAQIALDVLGLFVVQAGISVGFFVILFCTVGAFLGSCLGIYIMQTLSSNADNNIFAYYSWGAALFTFILYMIV